jgi:hypothetical protein
VELVLGLCAMFAVGSGLEGLVEEASLCASGGAIGGRGHAGVGGIARGRGRQVFDMLVEVVDVRLRVCGELERGLQTCNVLVEVFDDGSLLLTQLLEVFQVVVVHAIIMDLNSNGVKRALYANHEPHLALCIFKIFKIFKLF